MVNTNFTRGLNIFSKLLSNVLGTYVVMAHLIN